MKNTKGMIGLAAFVVSLWAIVVISYARQANDEKGVQGRILPLAQSSCSSSSSTSSSHAE